MLFRLLCLLLSVSFLVPPVYAQDIFNSRGKRQDIPGPRGRRQDIPGPRGRRQDIPSGNRQPRRDFRNLEERKEWIRRNQQTDYGQKQEEQARDQADNQKRHKAFMTDYYFKLQVIKELREQPAGGLADVQLRNLLKEQIWDVYSGMQSLIHILSGPLSGVSSIHAMDSATLNGRVDDLIWLAEKDPKSAPVLAKIKAARQEAMFALQAIKNNDVKLFRLHAKLGNGFLDKAGVLLDALRPIFELAMNTIILRPKEKKKQKKRNVVVIRGKEKKKNKKKEPEKKAIPPILLIKKKRKKKGDCPAPHFKAHTSWTLDVGGPNPNFKPRWRNYRDIFFNEYKSLRKYKTAIEVHHSIEQQIFKRFPSFAQNNVFSRDEILYDIRNLRGICGNEAKQELHRGRIAALWREFYEKYKGRKPPTRLDVMRWNRHIDEVVGFEYYPFRNPEEDEPKYL